MRHKKNIIIIAMCIAVFVMGVGYALLSTQMHISGSAGVTSNWKVEFSEIRTIATKGGATNKVTPSITATTANFEVDLVLPGDEITYEIDVTNYGDIDAEVQGATYYISGSEAIYVSIDGIRKGALIGSCEGLKECPTVTLTLKIGYKIEITEEPENKTKDIQISLNVGQYVESNPTEDGELIPELKENITLVHQILSDNAIQSDVNIDFGQISSDTNGKGLYYTSTNTEDNKPTYYFRGDVQNNYVVFGKENTYSCTYNGKTVYDETGYGHVKTEKFCLETPVCMFGSEPSVGFTENECASRDGTWTNEMATLSTAVEDIYWRIVRINEDGSIRIVKQDSAGMAKYTVYNDLQNDNAYVGYMYGSTGQTGDNAYNLTHSNDNSSVIKTYVDDWYTNYTNLSNYKYSHLADAGYCNDRSVAPSAGLWSSDDTALGYGQNITVYGAAGRLVEFKSSSNLTAKENPQPQFKCPNEGRDLFTLSTSSKGNKALTNPVGLLTADEVVYAGGVYAKNNNSMYLSNGIGWTMSPIYFNGMGFVSSGTMIYYDYLMDSSTAYPVINLSSTVVLSDEIPSSCTKLDGTQACPYIIKTN